MRLYAVSYPAVFHAPGLARESVAADRKFKVSDGGDEWDGGKRAGRRALRRFRRE